MPHSNMSVRNGGVRKSDVSDALVPGITRTIRTAGGKGSLSDAIDASTKTIDRALTGESMPEFHTLLNMAAVDQTALNEALALVGLTATPLRAQPANDMSLLSALTGAGAELAKRLLDGFLCHRDKGELAEIFRALIPGMQSIVDENDRLKSGRAA